MHGQGYPAADNIRFGGFSTDFRFHRPSLCLYRLDDGTLVSRLGRRALQVLNVLVEQAPDTVSERVLLDRIWGPHPDKRNLDVQISNLRRVLEEGAPKDALGCVIQNVPRRGYRFASKWIPMLPEASSSSVVDPHFASTFEGEMAGDSALLFAVIKSGTEKLRVFTEGQQKLINDLRTKLGVTERLLEAVCRVVIETGMSFEQLRAKVIEIRDICRERIDHRMSLCSSLIDDLITLQTVDLQKQDNGSYVLEATGSTTNAKSPTDIGQRSVASGNYRGRELRRITGR